MERLASPVRRVDAFKSEPLGRYGSVRDIADATVYLFSDAFRFNDSNLGLLNECYKKEVHSINTCTRKQTTLPA
jgi:hypothetical protein